jgi:subtilisin family serine protease
MPEHSVVFEDIREHINPSLFSNPPRRTDAPSMPGRDNELLKSSEESISRWFTLWYSDDLSPEKAAAICKRSGAVEYAEPVYARELCYVPNDGFLDSLYAPSMMKLYQAWDIVRCDSAIPNNDTMILADVDIGVWMDHPDLVDAIWHNAGEEGYDDSGHDKIRNNIDDDSDGYIDDYEGWDFVGFGNNIPGGGPDKSPWSVAPPYHGTHTSGIMAATGNNKIGIAGVAFGAKVIIIKAAADASPDGVNPPIVEAGPEGIVFATDHKAKIINCSFGGPERSLLEQTVVDYAYARGSIVVVAAGNTGNYEEFYPASCTHAFSVSSIDSSGGFSQSNPDYNRHVAVVAPGGGSLDQILSTVYPDSDAPTGYGRLWGTSMAAPQVSGALGLVWQRYPKFTNRQAMERLRVTCDTLGAFDNHPGFNGNGLINIYRAVTDPKAYSLRVEDPGKLTFAASGIHQVQLTLRNYLDNLPHALVRIEVLDSVDDQRIPIPSRASHISITPVTSDLGYLGTLDSTHLALNIQTDGKIRPESKVLVRLWLSDSSVSYVGDYDYFEFTVNPGYETLDANDITATFDDKGCIGFRDQLLDQQGDGFVWRNAPASILPAGKAVLLGGGLMVARDAQHVVDGFGTYNDDFIQRYHSLNPDSTIARSQFTPFGPGQTIAATYSDTLADSSEQVGIRVSEHAYAFAVPATMNTVVADYTFAPRGNSNPFDAGLYMDWDIGNNGSGDTAQFDTADSIFYIWRIAQHYPVVGMKLTSHIASGRLTYYAIRNDADDGGFHLIFLNDLAGRTSSFPDSIKWAFLQHNKSSAGKGDVAVVLGVRSLTFSKDAPKLTYVMGFGETQADVRRSLENTQALIEGRLAVHAASSPDETDLQVWPDPATNFIRVQAGAGESMEARIWDALGRCALPLTRFNSGSSLDISTLASGIYTIEAIVSGKHLFKTMVKE